MMILLPLTPQNIDDLPRKTMHFEVLPNNHIILKSKSNRYGRSTIQSLYRTKCMK